MSLVTKQEGLLAQWGDRIKEQAQGEQTVAAYCAERGLSVSTFYAWKARLSKPGSLVVRSARSTAAFVDLGSLNESASMSRAPMSDVPMSDVPVVNACMDIRLDLGCGMTLTITRR